MMEPGRCHIQACTTSSQTYFTVKAGAKVAKEREKAAVALALVRTQAGKEAKDRKKPSGHTSRKVYRVQCGAPRKLAQLNVFFAS